MPKTSWSNFFFFADRPLTHGSSSPARTMGRSKRSAYGGSKTSRCECGQQHPDVGGGSEQSWGDFGKSSAESAKSQARVLAESLPGRPAFGYSSADSGVGFDQILGGFGKTLNNFVRMWGNSTKVGGSFDQI